MAVCFFAELGHAKPDAKEVLEGLFVPKLKGNGTTGLAISLLGLVNCLEFAKELTSGVDIFVNESFSHSHKVLASTVGVARFCYACIAGFHFEESLYLLENVTDATKKPYVEIIGGSDFYNKAVAL
ncbi:hypothetical protein K1719_026602 [Acacia pycnantha]|nr:hypothetical protein K1719_026602 [Acacia pycnantha]